MIKIIKIISPIWNSIASDERRLTSLLFAAAALVILTALASQYIGGLQPCPLCLDQRLPYYLGVPILALIYFSPTSYTKYGLLLIRRPLCVWCRVWVLPCWHRIRIMGRPDDLQSSECIGTNDHRRFEKRPIFPSDYSLRCRRFYLVWNIACGL